MSISDKISFAIAVIAGVCALIALGYTIVTFHIRPSSRWLPSFVGLGSTPTQALSAKSRSGKGEQPPVNTNRRFR